MLSYESTVKNFKELGFAYFDKKLMLLRISSSDNEYRRQIVKNDYRIVLYMGDNLNDFSSESRKKSAEERFAVTDDNMDKFSKQWIVLPNPSYDECEGAIYDYNWEASAKEKVVMRKKHLIKWYLPK